MSQSLSHPNPPPWRGVRTFNFSQPSKRGTSWLYKAGGVHCLLERHSCLSHSPGLATALFPLNVPVSPLFLPLATQPQSFCQEILYQGHEDKASGRPVHCLSHEMKWRQEVEYGVTLGKSGMRATTVP